MDKTVVLESIASICHTCEYTTFPTNEASMLFHLNNYTCLWITINVHIPYVINIINFVAGTILSSCLSPSRNGSQLGERNEIPCQRGS